MIPPKSGVPEMSPPLGRMVDAGPSGDPRRRRAREDGDAAEGVGEAVSTAAAALKAERYRPKIFGFQVNEIAKLQRWQEAIRDKCVFASSLRSYPFCRRVLISLSPQTSCATGVFRTGQ